MTEVYIPSFSPKDPDDICSRNFTIGGLLAKVGGTYASSTVFLGAASSDTAMIVNTVAYDSVKQQISFRESGGTVGAKYLVTCRVVLADGRQYDQSAWQEVAQR